MSESVVLPDLGRGIAEAFRIECRLGAGQTSAVYGATAHATGQRFALRCWLTRDASALAQATQQFIRRAREARLFQHPNIVEVFTVSEIEGTLFAVTEWLEGTTLERYLHRHGTLSLAQSLELLLPCIDVLGAAHEAGIVHGDLRPANIFLCREAPAQNTQQTQDTQLTPRARVLNFELGSCLPEASAASALQDRWDRRDTRQYVPPELLRGRALDARSDVYTFGVLLYRSLAGVLPFSTANSADLAHDIVSGAQVPFRQRATHLAPHVLDVIDRAMATDPSQRYANMRELGIALLRAVSRPAPLHFDRPALESTPAPRMAAERHVGLSIAATACFVVSIVVAAAVIARFVYAASVQPAPVQVVEVPAPVPLPAAPRRSTIIDVDIAAPVVPAVTHAEPRADVSKRRQRSGGVHSKRGSIRR